MCTVYMCVCVRIRVLRACVSALCTKSTHSDDGGNDDGDFLTICFMTTAARRGVLVNNAHIKATFDVRRLDYAVLGRR